jgi:hypothetical protein
MHDAIQDATEENLTVALTPARRRRRSLTYGAPGQFRLEIIFSRLFRRFSRLLGSFVELIGNVYIENNFWLASLVQSFPFAWHEYMNYILQVAYTVPKKSVHYRIYSGVSRG